MRQPTAGRLAIARRAGNLLQQMLQQTGASRQFNHNTYKRQRRHADSCCWCRPHHRASAAARTRISARMCMRELEQLQLQRMSSQFRLDQINTIRIMLKYNTRRMRNGNRIDARPTRMTGSGIYRSSVTNHPHIIMNHWG